MKFENLPLSINGVSIKATFSIKLPNKNIILVKTNNGIGTIENYGIIQIDGVIMEINDEFVIETNELLLKGIIYQKNST